VLRLPATLEFHAQCDFRRMVGHKRPMPDPTTAVSAPRTLERIFKNAKCRITCGLQMPTVSCRRIFGKLNAKRVTDQNFYSTVISHLIEQKHSRLTNLTASPAQSGALVTSHPIYAGQPYTKGTLRDWRQAMASTRYPWRGNSPQT